jgi:hypothetical protein
VFHFQRDRVSLSLRRWKFDPRKKGNKISNAQHHLAPAMCDDRRGRRAKRYPESVRWLAAAVRFTRFGSAHTLSFDLHNLARRRRSVSAGCVRVWLRKYYSVLMAYQSHWINSNNVIIVMAQIDSQVRTRLL